MGAFSIKEYAHTLIVKYNRMAKGADLIDCCTGKPEPVMNLLISCDYQNTMLSDVVHSIGVFNDMVDFVITDDIILSVGVSE